MSERYTAQSRVSLPCAPEQSEARAEEKQVAATVSAADIKEPKSREVTDGKEPTKRQQLQTDESRVIILTNFCLPPPSQKF